MSENEKNIIKEENQIVNNKNNGSWCRSYVINDNDDTYDFFSNEVYNKFFAINEIEKLNKILDYKQDEKLLKNTGKFNNKELENAYNLEYNEYLDWEIAEAFAEAFLEKYYNHIIINKRIHFNSKSDRNPSGIDINGVVEIDKNNFLFSFGEIKKASISNKSNSTSTQLNSMEEQLNSIINDKSCKNKNREKIRSYAIKNIIWDSQNLQVNNINNITIRDILNTAKNNYNNNDENIGTPNYNICGVLIRDDIEKNLSIDFNNFYKKATKLCDDNKTIDKKVFQLGLIFLFIPIKSNEWEKILKNKRDKTKR